MRTLGGVAVGALAALTVLAGCAAPYDDDGEGHRPGTLALAPAAAGDGAGTPVVVDTDLGGDDLVALAFLLRHPDVEVEAVTIAGTGLVGCDPGVDLVADLVRAAGVAPVPVACGREEAGPGGRPFPAQWREYAATGTGLPRAETTFSPTPEPAPQLIARLVDRVEDLQVIALGPLTNLADLAEQSPDAYARLDGVHSMAGALDIPEVDGVAEWNAAADSKAFAVVLDAPAPLTVVPDDPIPAGNPAALDAPVVGAIAAVIDYPKWWDLATSAAFVAPDAVEAETGAWTVDAKGRLRRTGDGPVRVVRSLDRELLEAEYARALPTTG